MPDFKNLIEYLRLHRRGEEDAAAQDNTIMVTLNYLDTGEEACTTTKDDLENDNATYNDLSFEIDEHNAQEIYLWDTGTERSYYVKTAGGSYINLQNSATETPPEQSLQAFALELGSGSYFYYTPENRVIYSTTDLSAVFVYNDVIEFGPDIPYIKEIETDEYEYDYTKHRTTFGNILNIVRQGSKSYDEDNVMVTKNPMPGSLQMIPVLEADLYAKTYVLRYLYHVPNTFRPSFGFTANMCALVLEFGSVGGLLSFLNETLFSQGLRMDEPGYTPPREDFRVAFNDQVLRVFKNMISSRSKMHYTDAMELLHYLPEAVLDAVGSELLWILVESAIDSDRLNNRSQIAEEDLFIKLLEIILDPDDVEEKKKQQAKFMRFLAGTTLNNQLCLEFLYERLHGDNGTKFVQMVNSAWRVSMFTDPENTLFESSDGPLFLPYESEKWLGFYFSSADLEFATNEGKQRMIRVSRQTGEYKTVYNPLTKENDEVPIYEHFWYHPFHPILLKNIARQDTEIKMDAVVPAFILLANEDKQFWHNVMTGGEYAFDTLTTISGIGNIAKFRFLTKLVRVGEATGAAAKAIRATNILRYVTGAAGVIYISSGSVSIMLKLTGLRDTKFGNALWEVLMLLELISLTGEITASMKAGLRKSAKELIEHEEAIRKAARTTEEAGEVEKLIREVRELSGMAENIGIHTSMTVEQFEAGLKRLLNIKPEQAFEHLDEAMKYFNHHVFEGRIRQISDTNCVNVVEAVEEFLKTGKIKTVKPSGYQDVSKLEGIYSGEFRTYTMPSLRNVMKEGERGIIYAIREWPAKGHVFNVIKKDGQLIFKDAQTFGGKANLKNGYIQFKYLKTF